MNKIETDINNALLPYNLTDTEQNIIQSVIKELLGIDQKINEKVEKEKKDSQCFSFSLSEDFCNGTLEQRNKPDKSHVVPKNQLDAFKKDYKIIYKKSFKLFDQLSLEIKEINSTRAPVFVGFCKSCEKNFSNELNIDKNIDFTKEHMFKSLYRYLAKEIAFRKAYIQISRELSNDENEKISSKNYELFYEKIYKSNANIQLNKNIFYKNVFKTIQLDIGTKLYCDYKIVLNKKSQAKIYEFKTFRASSDLFPIIGQSIITVPIQYDDYETLGYFYFNFVYDSERKETICYLLTYHELWEKIKNKQNKNIILNKNQNMLLMLILAFLNSNDLYFTQNFKDNIIPYMIKYYEESSDKDLMVKYENLVSKIKQEKI